MKIVLQHLTKKFPARGPVRGRKNREDVIAVNDFDFEIVRALTNRMRVNPLRIARMRFSPVRSGDHCVLPYMP